MQETTDKETKKNELYRLFMREMDDLNKVYSSFCSALQNQIELRAKRRAERRLISSSRKKQ